MEKKIEKFIPHLSAEFIRSRFGISKSSAKSDTLPKDAGFIVIDGTDGSGKATQTNLLINKLKQSGHHVEVADFPQYNTKSAGLVEEYLDGKYGNTDEVGPYIASIFYASDRYDACFKIKKWLNEGKIVVSNRYVTANMAHQGCKINNSLEKKIFFDWLYNLEYKLFGIPKPDLTIILHVKANIAQKLCQQRQKQDWVGKTRDIHQDNLEHLEKAEQIYLEIARTFLDLTLIECVKDNQIMPQKKINDLIWQEVIKIIEPHSHKDMSPNFKILHKQKSNQNPQTKIVSARIQPKIRNLQLSIQRLSLASKLPAKKQNGNVGLDLFSSDYYSLMPREQTIIKTGIKITIPIGYVGFIYNASGSDRQKIYVMTDVIDPDFKNEITVNLINHGYDMYHIAPGQKVAQMLIKKVELPEIIETGING